LILGRGERANNPSNFHISKIKKIGTKHQIIVLLHSFDIAEIFKVRMKNKKGPRDENGLEISPRFKHYSLRHTCMVLLETDMQEEAHDPLLDAKYSVTLFEKYRKRSGNEMKCVKESLSRTMATER